MKGKYMSTNLMLAVLAGGKAGSSVLVEEKTALTHDHKLIWSKTTDAANSVTEKPADRDKLKMA